MSERNFKRKTEKANPWMHIQEEFPKEENGIIYVRQSSLFQMQNNIHSFEMQTDKFIEHFRNMGCTGQIEIIADDEALSGTLDIHKRPGLSRAMRLIEGKELLGGKRIRWAAAVAVNRFTRDPWLITSGVLMKTCHEHDIWIATLRMYFNFKDPYCQRIFMIEAEEAARHLDWMKLVLGGARSVASDNGYYDGRFLSIGYIVDRSDPKHKKYMIYEPHARVIRWLFRRFLELDGHLQELCREIEKMPYLFPKFESWVDPRDIRRTTIAKAEGSNYLPGQSGIRSILTNPAYIGWWIPIDGGIVENSHKPIIDETLFIYAHKRLSSYDLQGNRQKPEKVIRSPKVEALLKKVAKDRLGNKIQTVSDIGGLYRCVVYSRLSFIKAYSISTKTVDNMYLEKFFERARSLPQIYADWEGKEGQREKREQERAERERLIKKSIAEVDRKLIEIDDTINTPGCPKSLKIKLFKDYEQYEVKKNALELEFNKSKEEDEEALIFEIATLVPQILIEWDNLPFMDHLHFVGALTRRVILDHVAPGWLKMVIEWKIPEWGIDVGHIRRDGCNRSTWKEEELEILYGMYPTEDAADILEALPSRTWKAIKHRAMELGIERPRKKPNRINVSKTVYDNTTMADFKYAEENGIDPTVKNAQWSR